MGAGLGATVIAEGIQAREEVGGAARSSACPGARATSTRGPWIPTRRSRPRAWRADRCPRPGPALVAARPMALRCPRAAAAASRRGRPGRAARLRRRRRRARAPPTPAAPRRSRASPECQPRPRRAPRPARSATTSATRTSSSACTRSRAAGGSQARTRRPGGGLAGSPLRRHRDPQRQRLDRGRQPTTSTSSGVGLRFEPNSQGGYDVVRMGADVPQRLRPPRHAGRRRERRRRRSAFCFSFFGASRGTAFVNSDGNMTFTRGDSGSEDRSLGRVLSGPPRVALVLRRPRPEPRRRRLRQLDGAARSR